MSKSDKPVSGTREWAASNANIQRGCLHGCLYCYANANALRFKQVEAGEWTTGVINQAAVDRAYGLRTSGTIMFPTTHDITPENVEAAITVLRKMLASGNSLLIVSKPHLDVLAKLCANVEEWKDKILFRFTIGSRVSQTLALWEPGAPSFHDRFMSLRYAFHNGFATSVSMEPLLDPDEDSIVALVEEMSPFVTDSIWLGKMNRAEERIKRNGLWTPEVEEKLAELLASQSDERILALYERLKDHPKVRWKESIKAVVGLEIPTEAGLDI